MTSSDLSADIRRKLDEFRKSGKEYQDFQRIMIRYATERFLYRLFLSAYKDQFILKGAMLLELYLDKRTRTTANADFLLFGDFNRDSLKNVIREICAIQFDDGLSFNLNGISATINEADRDYPGYKVAVPTSLGNAPIPLSIDICFGQAVYPDTPVVTYLSLLDFPDPQIRVYPPETIISEKFQTIVKKGMANNRLKDYYDLWALGEEREFDGRILLKAFASTFERRKTEAPSKTPIGLTDIYYSNKKKHTDWRAFLKKHGLNKSLFLEAVSKSIITLAMPVAEALAAEIPFEKMWKDRAWTEQSSRKWPSDL